MVIESEYLMYVLITEKKTNQRVFEWRRGTGNLILGLKVTAAFIEDKLGIPIPIMMFSPNGHGKNQAGSDPTTVVMVQPGMGLMIQDAVDLEGIIKRLCDSGGIRVDGDISGESAQT